MNWHANIDVLGGNRYRVRVTELVERDGAKVSGKELCRFDHSSELRNRNLREEVERIAGGKLRQ